MKFLSNILVLLILISNFSFAQKKYFKGNTHTHCYPYSGDITDTSYTASKVVSQYKARGYDFLVFTDHGAWFNAAPLSTPDFTVINGEEAGISGGGLWGHFTALDLKSRVSGANLTHQQLIDLIYNQNAVPFLNHPRYDQIPITAKQVIENMQSRLMHVEIYNGVTINQPGHTDISVWDSVLSTGRLIYGVAADDSHRESHQAKAWIMVYSSSNNKDTLVKAIRNGDFYCSTGIILDSIFYSSNRIYLKSQNGNSIKFIGKDGNTLSTVSSNEASYTVIGTEKYVRAEIGNSSGQRGWIQPLMVTGSTGSIEENRINDFKLYQNYPNPFNPMTNIKFHIPKSYYVKLNILDVLGREIATLVDEEKSNNTYNYQFSIHNSPATNQLPSGIYFYRMIAGDFSETKKMILLR
ncbi:MAG: T9SS type A sorting domain-containing protein [Ignavibacteria bacterium]|nr:T9SS type A sorting domain-containing protein [Ignavibacteria bacterium]